MDSVMRVKKSLSAPIRKLSSCVSGLKGRRPHGKRSNRYRRGRGWRGRRGAGGGGGGAGGGGGGGGGAGNRSGRMPPPPSHRSPQPVTLCSYQADLEKQRKLRETMNEQKNAQRAAMRAHFRRKYQLSESPKDAGHLRSVGGKVSLPRELSKLIHPESSSKGGGGFNLLSAFQGLSFGTAALSGGSKHGRTATPTPAGGAESCKVM